jgi:hypothetical protein
MLLMSRRTRRTLNRLARQSGAFLEADRNEFGQMVQFYSVYAPRGYSRVQAVPPRI